MIVSIGIDLTEISRLREALARTPRLRERVFTEAEREYCDARGDSSAQHYAARFAAKEAAFKALGTGWSGGLSWRHVEVIHAEGGAPRLVLRGRARQLFEALGATDAHVSLTHTTEHALAQVIFEKR